MRIYTVTAPPVAQTTAFDLFEIVPAANTICQILGFEIGQTTEAGDAESEMINFEVLRGYTVSGSGGTAPTPGACSEGDVAASFTAEVNNSTQAGTSTPVSLHEGSFNVLGGYSMMYPGGMELSITSRTVLSINTAGADSITFTGTMWVAEIG